MDELKFYEEQLKSENLEQALMGVQVLAQIPDSQARKILINNLNHPLWQVRNSIVEVLSETLTREDVPLLIEKIKSQDAKERNSAISIMQERGDIVIPYLVKSLKSDDVDVKILSLNTLGLVNAKEAIEPIKEMLKDDDQNVREAAIEALGRLKAEKEVQLLTEMMLKEEDEWSKIPYIVALGEIGDPYPLPYLLEYLDDEVLQYPSIEALGRIGDERAFMPLAKFLENDDEDIIITALDSRISIFEKSKRMLELEGNSWIIESFRKKNKNIVKKEAVSNILSILIKKEDVERIRKIFTFLKWSEIKMNVSSLIPYLEKVELNEVVEDYMLLYGEKDCDIVGKIINPETHPLVTKSLIKFISERQKLSYNQLVTVLSSPYPEVRATAAEYLLSRVEDIDELKKILREILKNEKEREVLDKISLVVGKRHLCKPMVKELLKENNPVLREFAVRSLSIMGDKESFEQIFNHLNDPEASIRAVVVRSAGYFFSRHKELIQETTESDIALLLNDEDYDVKDETVIALGRIGTDSAIDILINAIDGYDDLNLPLVFKILADKKSDKIKEKFLSIIEKGDDERKLIFAIEKFPDAIDEEEKSKYIFSIAKYLDTDDEYFLSVVLNSLSKLNVNDEAVLEKIRDIVIKSDSWNILEPAIRILGNQKYIKASDDIIKKCVEKIDSEMVLNTSLNALMSMGVFSKEMVFKMFNNRFFSEELFLYLRYFGVDNYKDVLELTEKVRSSHEKRALLKVLKDIESKSSIEKLKGYLNDPVVTIRGTSYLHLYSIAKHRNDDALFNELLSMDIEKIDPFLLEFNLSEEMK